MRLRGIMQGVHHIHQTRRAVIECKSLAKSGSATLVAERSVNMAFLNRKGSG
jgi:hypothetical protein